MRRDGCSEQITGRDGRSDDGGGGSMVDARDRSMGRDAIHGRDRSMGRDAIINSRDWSMAQDRSMGQDATNARDRTLDEQFFLRRLSCSMQRSSELSLASSQSAPGSFRASSHWIRNDAGDHFASAATTPGKNFTAGRSWHSQDECIEGFFVFLVYVHAKKKRFLVCF
jgi:hypothetical protein